MERKFTLRLSDIDAKNLDILKEYLDEKIDARAIKIAIAKFKDRQETLKKANSTILELRKENAELKNLINEFKGSLNKIINF